MRLKHTHFKLSGLTTLLRRSGDGGQKPMYGLKIFHRKTPDHYTVISQRVWVGVGTFRKPIFQKGVVLCQPAESGQIWITQILFVLCMNKDSELVDCCGPF